MRKLKRIVWVLAIFLTSSNAYVHAQQLSGKPGDSLVTRSPHNDYHGQKYSKVVIRTPDGKNMNWIMNNETEFYFYVNGKIYLENELKALDNSPSMALLHDPSTKHGFGLAWEFDLNPFETDGLIFWFGTPPAHSAAYIKHLDYQRKYSKRTLTGVVKGYVYSKANPPVATGFTLEWENEVFNVFIYTPRAEKLLENLVPGDIITITPRSATFNNGADLPALIPDSIIKEGEKLMVRGYVQI